MIDLDRVTAALGVLVQPAAAGGFAHLATCWSLEPGAWITVWSEEDEPPGDLRLLVAHSGAVAAVEQWEQDGGIVGFRSVAAPATLAQSPEADIAKREALTAVGYPCVIDHPAFCLHRGSLDTERYLPYLCPWQVAGHLALYSAGHGWLTGRFYNGMAGAPVCRSDGSVVGMLVDGQPAADHPPLARFRRLGG